MAKHKKLYHRFGNGVGLWCGSKLIASNPDYQYVNFSVSNCPECGMEVQTTGCSPETDKVQEFEREER